VKRSATIFIGEDRILLQPNDTSPYGNYAGCPVRTLPHAVSSCELLEILEETLADCRTNFELPVDLKARLKPLIAASGQKTWNAISRNFAYVGVSENNDELTFFSGFPEKGAFLFRREAHWHCNRKYQTQMAAALRAAASVAIEAQNLANPALLR
jgi:hypothetical protein